MTQSVVVTGSTSGIGRGIADHFARSGWAVVGLDNEAPDGPSPCVDVVLGDVRDRSSHERAAGLAEEAGTLGAWVNCAGVAEKQSVHLATADHLDRTIGVNLVGVFWGCSVAVETMLERGGSIVNIASTQGVRGASGFPAYAASKGGVLGLTTQVAAEFARSRIRANAILPGVIHAGMNENALENAADPDQLGRSWDLLTPIGRLGTETDIASLTYFLCEESGSFITGAAIPIDGGQLVLLPDASLTRGHSDS